MTILKPFGTIALIALVSFTTLTAQTTSRTAPAGREPVANTATRSKTATGTSQDLEKRSTAAVKPAESRTTERTATTTQQSGTLRGSDRQTPPPTRNQLSKPADNKPAPAPAKKPADGRTKTGDKIDHNMKGPKGETVYMGPRGGRYYLDKKNNRIYIRRDAPQPAPANRPANTTPAKAK